MNQGAGGDAEPATVEGDWMAGTTDAAGGDDWGAAPAAASW